MKKATSKDLTVEQINRLKELEELEENETLTLDEECELFLYSNTIDSTWVNDLRTSLEEELKKDIDDEERIKRLRRCLLRVKSYQGKQQRDYANELFVDTSEDRVKPMRTLQKILDKVEEKTAIKKIPLSSVQIKSRDCCYPFDSQ